MKKVLSILIPIFFLYACGTNISNNKEPINVESVNPSENIPVKEKEDLTQYFLAGETTAEFKGEGNENASFFLKTQHPYTNYVITYEDNGGTTFQRIYQISNKKISLLAENGEAYDAKTPSLEELKSMQEVDIYLATPLKVGTEFNHWKITSTKASIETELQTFNDVIVIEKKGEQGDIIRKYFAKNFGEIKREFIMNENGENIVISSTIEKVM